jgi:deazaflavin-dependent oxidoreductase (nitroreductase family)
VTSEPRQNIADHNSEVVERFRANGRRLDDAGMPIVLITHHGRRSGRSFTNPLVAAGDGDDVIIAATMGGMPEHPQWYLNLVNDPNIVVEWDGESYPAVAEEISDEPARARLVEILTKVFPKLPTYESRAAGHRVIPIIRLRRAA